MPPRRMAAILTVLLTLAAPAPSMHHGVARSLPIRPYWQLPPLPISQPQPQPPPDHSKFVLPGDAGDWPPIATPAKAADYQSWMHRGPVYDLVESANSLTNPAVQIRRAASPQQLPIPLTRYSVPHLHRTVLVPGPDVVEDAVRFPVEETPVEEKSVVSYAKPMLWAQKPVETQSWDTNKLVTGPPHTNQLNTQNKLDLEHTVAPTPLADLLVTRIQDGVEWPTWPPLSTIPPTDGTPVTETMHIEVSTQGLSSGSDMSGYTSVGGTIDQFSSVDGTGYSTWPPTTFTISYAPTSTTIDDLSSDNTPYEVSTFTSFYPERNEGSLSTNSWPLRTIQWQPSTPTVTTITMQGMPVDTTTLVSPTTEVTMPDTLDVVVIEINEQETPSPVTSEGEGGMSQPFSPTTDFLVAQTITAGTEGPTEGNSYAPAESEATSTTFAALSQAVRPHLETEGPNEESSYAPAESWAGISELVSTTVTATPQAEQFYDEAEREISLATAESETSAHTTSAETSPAEQLYGQADNNFTPVENETIVSTTGSWHAQEGTTVSAGPSTNIDTHTEHVTIPSHGSPIDMTEMAEATRASTTLETTEHGEALDNIETSYWPYWEETSTLDTMSEPVTTADITTARFDTPTSDVPVESSSADADALGSGVTEAPPTLDGPREASFAAGESGSGSTPPVERPGSTQSIPSTTPNPFTEPPLTDEGAAISTRNSLVTDQPQWNMTAAPTIAAPAPTHTLKSSPAAVSDNLKDFSDYDGIVFEDSSLPDTNVLYPHGYEYSSDPDYLSDLGNRQRLPLKPPAYIDTKGFEIASLVREPPAEISHRRSDVLIEDDDDDDDSIADLEEPGSNDVGTGAGKGPTGALSFTSWDTFEGQMLRRMIPLVVRQMRVGSVTERDVDRLKYIFGPLWPEVERLSLVARTGWQDAKQNRRQPRRFRRLSPASARRARETAGEDDDYDDFTSDNGEDYVGMRGATDRTQIEEEYAYE